MYYIIPIATHMLSFCAQSIKYCCFSKDIHKGVELISANGRKVLALTVFAHALRFFKEHCLQELSDQSSTRIVNDDIRWVITVPAIWRQPAKQFMRLASYDVRRFSF